MQLVQQTTDGPWLDTPRNGRERSRPSASATQTPAVWPSIRWEKCRCSEGRPDRPASRSCFVGTHRRSQRRYGASERSSCRLADASGTRQSPGVLSGRRDGADIDGTPRGPDPGAIRFSRRRDREILLAGPAEGWRIRRGGPAGRNVESGQARAAPRRSGDGAPHVRPRSGRWRSNASIVPACRKVCRAVQDYAAATTHRGPLSAGAGVRSFTNRLAQLLGEQDV